MHPVSVHQGLAVMFIPVLAGKLLAQPELAVVLLLQLEVHVQLPPTAQLQTMVAGVVYVQDYHWQTVSPVMNPISVHQGLAVMFIPVLAVKLLAQPELAVKLLLHLEVHVQLPPTAQLQTMAAGVVYVQDHHWKAESTVMNPISVNQGIVQSFLALAA